MEWVTEQAAIDLLRFGIHGDVILKSDQEPAIVDVLKEISKLRGSRRTIIEASPSEIRSPTVWQRRAVQSMEKLIRVHKLAIETRIKEKLSVRHPLFGMVGGVLCGLYNSQGRIRWQDGPTATEGEDLESGDGGVRHGRDVQSVRKSSRVFDG